MIYTEETLESLKRIRGAYGASLRHIESQGHVNVERELLDLANLDVLITHLEKAADGETFRQLPPVVEKRPVVRIAWDRWYSRYKNYEGFTNWDFNNGQPCYFQGRAGGGVIVDQGDPDWNLYVPWKYVNFIEED